MGRDYYWVYILANRKDGTLYTGITSSLQRRVWQHRQDTPGAFSARYGIHRLVYFEEFHDATNAIAREKKIKAGSHKKKIALIENDDSEWNDLSADWFE